jgi:hypothetical protein
MVVVGSTVGGTTQFGFSAVVGISVKENSENGV